MNEPVSVKSGMDALEFCLPSATGNNICLSELKGRWVVLYFYPKDGTSG
jgi:thioredoxin-dependent peroxiredoxin